VGTPLFGELPARQWLYLGTLAYALFWIAISSWHRSTLPDWDLAWDCSRCKRNGGRRLEPLTWAVQGVALIRVWLFGPWGTMAGRAR
jgi:hypothetical protein